MRVWGKIQKDINYMQGFFDDPVEVTEKLDGSQINFGMTEEGKLWIRSRGAIINPDSPPKLFSKAVETIISVQGLLVSGFTYHGEAITSNRHNTLEYSKTPKGYIALFGLFDCVGGSLRYEEIVDHANNLGLDVAPLIYSGTVKSFEHFKELVPEESYLGGPAEGIVAKNYNRPCVLFGQEFPLTQFKYVTDQFKEKHTKNPDFKSKADILVELGDSLNTEARWLKSVQRLRDMDKLQNSPKDIGPLIGMISDDIKEEEEQWIKDALFKVYWKPIQQRALKGFPEWYKEYLAKQLFDVEQQESTDS